MRTLAWSDAQVGSRSIVLGLMLVVAVIVVLPSRLVAADATAEPAIPPSPGATLTPAEAACDSLADLHLIVEFLESTDVEDDGWLPIFVGVVAGLSEARDLADALDDTYRPLVDELIVALERLGATISELRELETIGSGIAAVGVAITDIGNALDELSARLRTPCPTAVPAASRITTA